MSANVRGLLPQLEHIRADGGYVGRLAGRVKAVCGRMLETVKRNDARADRASSKWRTGVALSSAHAGRLARSTDARSPVDEQR